MSELADWMERFRRDLLSGVGRQHIRFLRYRLRTESGHEGWAFTLTRDGAVAEQIRKSIAPVYVGTDVADRQKTFKTAKGRTYGSHSAGVGLRALSQVDLAAWDVAARLACPGAVLHRRERPHGKLGGQGAMLRGVHQWWLAVHLSV